MTPKNEADKPPLANVASPPQNADDTVAPNQEQTNLTLRKLQDALKDPEARAKLAEKAGITPEQMEQFARKFEKAPKATPGPGREIKIKPGQERKFNPNRVVPDLGTGARVSTKTVRDRGGIAQDQVRGNVEESRFVVPRELRAGFEAYKSTLSRSKTLNPTRAGSAPGSGGE